VNITKEMEKLMEALTEDLCNECLKREKYDGSDYCDECQFERKVCHAEMLSDAARGH